MNCGIVQVSKENEKLYGYVVYYRNGRGHTTWLVVNTYDLAYQNMRRLKTIGHRKVWGIYKFDAPVVWSKYDW